MASSVSSDYLYGVQFSEWHQFYIVSEVITKFRKSLDAREFCTTTIALSVLIKNLKASNEPEISQWSDTLRFNIKHFRLSALSSFLAIIATEFDKHCQDKC